ncbi:MAG: hypothetical protein JWR89_3850 [Tardiphaga sp.]|uniref:SCO family protein n=1 Tax=Tardiphaga sp. TaxID=1926292 RepID=UPI00262BB279|nr:SCO family protein [Tardiphaga sp.]MDB5503948.1 hypothetical protein [Tardiphaga sp.]
MSASPSTRGIAEVLSEIAAGNDGADRRAQLRLLDEGASIYQGKGATEVERLRATIMVRLARAGLADALMPYAVEELETATTAYPVAAAAQVVRSATALPDDIANLLAGAIDRIRLADDFVDFDSYPAPPDAGTHTAIGEATAALAAVLEKAAGATARSCCGGGHPAAASRPRHIDDVAGAVELQNQDGRCVTFRDRFAGRTSLIAFFYTRCMNPDKCSRTISQLVRLDRLLGARDPNHGVMLAGISYDPEYDLPPRLQRYGADRGMVFSETCQLFRATGSFASIRDGLDLGVGYSASTVNRHRIEILLCDASGAMVDFNARRLWDVEEAADAIGAMDAKRRIE